MKLPLKIQISPPLFTWRVDQLKKLIPSFLFLIFLSSYTGVWLTVNSSNSEFITTKETLDILGLSSLSQDVIGKILEVNQCNHVFISTSVNSLPNTRTE